MRWRCGWWGSLTGTEDQDFDGILREAVRLITARPQAARARS
jgi:hypothetical protein